MPRMSSELDALAGAFYSVFDNRGGRRPAVEDMTSLFAPQAVIAKRAGAGFELSTPAQFAQPRIDLLRGPALVGFHEWETSFDTRVDGDLALRTSRYEKSGTMEGRPYAGKGTKFFQFIRIEGNWRVLSLAWADDE